MESLSDLFWGSRSDTVMSFPAFIRNEGRPRVRLRTLFQARAGT